MYLFQNLFLDYWLYCYFTSRTLGTECISPRPVHTCSQQHGVHELFPMLVPMGWQVCLTHLHSWPLIPSWTYPTSQMLWCRWFWSILATVGEQWRHRRLPKSVLRSRLWKLAACLPADAWQGGKNKTNKRNSLESTDQLTGQWVSNALVAWSKFFRWKKQNKENTQDLASSIKYGAK